MNASQNDNGRKRETILSAAQEIFASKGYHGARTAEIAVAAGVSEGTLYNYFTSRDEIFASLFESRWQHFIDRVRRRIDRLDDPSDQLKAIFSEALKLFRLNKALAQMFLLENTPGSLFLNSAVAHRVADFLDIIAAILDEGKRRGVYHPDLDTRTARMVIYGTVQGILLSRVISDRATPEIRRRFRISMTQAARTIKLILKEGLTAPSR
jgi:TetR/AcrR family fatty acid metabolism transcriptional regulator